MRSALIARIALIALRFVCVRRSAPIGNISEVLAKTARALELLAAPLAVVELLFLAVAVRLQPSQWSHDHHVIGGKGCSGSDGGAVGWLVGAE